MTKAITTFTQGDQLPAHLAQGSGLGNENVGAGDLQVPHLDLIQQLSPQIQKSNAKYIAGAELGHIFDSLTGELHKHVFLVNLKYDVQYSVFKKRKLGGGFEGNFETAGEAAAHLEAEGLNPEHYDIVETGVHKCLMLDEKGEPKQPVLLYMNGSKMKVSKNWNTQIQLKAPNADRFATVWVASSVEETNKQGQPYQNWKVDFAGYAGEALFAEARKTYFNLVGKVDIAAA